MPSFTLQQLLAADSGDPSPSPAPGKLSTVPSVKVALIEGKCKDELGIVFDAIKAAPLCVNGSIDRCPDTKMQNGVNSAVGVVVSGENGVHDLEVRKVDSSCVYALNPYHVCADYCVEKMKEDSRRRRNSASFSFDGNGKLMMVDGMDVDPNCVNASNPYHKCAEYCHKRVGEMGSLQGRKSVSSLPESNGTLSMAERKDIDPNCVNASNPYHKCAEYCLERKHERGNEQVSSSPKGKEKLNMVERKDVDPNCVNASNPYHKCAEYCLERKQEMDSPQRRKSDFSMLKSKGNLSMVERKDVDPNCVNASNPYHKCAEYCHERKQEMDSQQGRKSDSSLLERKGNLGMLERKDVDPNCVNASNPYHKCAEYCHERKQEMDSQQEGRKADSSSLKRKGNLGMVERKDVDPNCVNASNPYHKCADYCLERKQEMNSQQGMKSDSSSLESKRNLALVEREDVNPNCVNASNPYHKCADYCLERKQERNSQQGMKPDSSSLKSKGNLAMMERKDVDPKCVNASNPYHKCAEYCLERKHEIDSQHGRKLASSSPKIKGKLVTAERKDVDPNCVYASNPYHKCGGHCIEKRQESDSQQGRNTVSSSPKSNVKLAILERKDVNPNCVNASNPYHKCAEYCHERKQETDSLQGSKSVSSSPKAKGKLIILVTKDVDPNCVNASNPYHKCAEYCFQKMNVAR